MKIIHFSADFTKVGKQLVANKICLIDNKNEKIEIDPSKEGAVKSILDYLGGRPCIFVGYDCSLEWAAFICIFDKLPPIIPQFCFDLRHKVLEIGNRDLLIPAKDMSTCVDKCHQIKKLLSILTETLGFEVPAEEILDSKETVDNSILDDPQKNLNPELWVDIESSELPRLNDKLRNQIISFAKRKAEEVGVRIKYLLMFGGSASYQYTDKSDIDCVIYAKSVKQEEYEALRKHFKDETSNFGEHVITLYLKPQTDRPLEISDAVYDVLNNSWIVPPLVLPQHFDPDVFFAPLIKEAERRARSFDLKFAKLLRLQADISDKKNALKLNPQDPVRIKRDIKDLKDDQILLIEDLVDQFHMIHEQRHELHRKLEQKVLQGETLSRFARFQSPEILWKYLDKHHYLDSLKKLETWLENHYEKKILQKEETKNSGDN